MHRTRFRALSAAGLATTALAVCSSAVAAQQPGRDEWVYVSWYVDAAIAGLVTLVVGGLLILVAREYTTRVTDRAIEKPLESFGWGFLALLLVIGLSIALVITIIGIFVAIPLLIAFFLFAIVAGEFGYLAIGRHLTDEWGPALVVAIVVSAFAGGVPILGALVGFVVGCVGIGAVIVEYRSESAEPDSPGDSSDDTWGDAAAGDSWGDGADRDAEVGWDPDDGTWGSDDSRDADDPWGSDDSWGATDGRSDDGDPWSDDVDPR